ncbi:hypothetical protein [Streptomyces gilvus]|uniref:hypothetical protein n=1 Tax=Streptomyces gilvus TaxID=2920937 RepID=UPI001F0E555E|nr:hypothetical protein [Streptomyces sp. CME 23]MCH5674714.1 hypothetical protein [Streptomyces sp. CME 23]
MLTEVASQHSVIPEVADFARGELPAPAATDDGNEWIDGFCWLYCGQQWTRVLWIGPARVAGTQAPMYACGPCIRELQERVWQSLLSKDRPAPSLRPGETAAPGQPASGRRTSKHRSQGRFLRRG